MIEILKQQFLEDDSAEEKLNKIREFLQVISLKIIYDKNFFKNMAFVGGTALRILFGLRRFSEDLDFSLTQKKGYNFVKVNSQIVNALKLYGLNVESQAKTTGNVHNSAIKFSGLLKDVGLSALGEQKLRIKIEVDANPPKGWHVQDSVVNKTYIFGIRHFDLPSLYATKLHACFYRKFTKGRDIYDLIWYLSKQVKPNFVLLNNAIKQTEGGSPKITAANFKNFLLKQIEKIDFKEAKRDVERFLEDKAELKLFELKAIKGLIAGRQV
jgi:predicted nucleotidyltransferase component of viral defense system